MHSPWINGSQGEQYAVPGMAALLIEGNRRNDEAWNNLGRIGGQVAAGIGGLVQGAADPKQFGGDTTKLGGALRAGLMNFNYAGSGSEGGSAFGRMTNPGGASSAGMNFKQFAAIGKTADGLRETIGAGTPRTPDQQPKILGYTDDEWKHLGTADKANAMQTWQQQQQAKATMLGYDTAMQHYHQIGQQMARQQADDAAQGRFTSEFRKATNPKLNMGTDGFSLFANAAMGKALTPGGTVNGQQMLDMALRAGMDPLKASAMAENLGRMAELGSQGFEFNPTSDVKDIGNGLNFVRTSRGGGQIVQTPESISAAAKAREGAKTTTRFKAVPSIVDPSGFATSVEADNPEDLQRGMAMLKQAGGGNKTLTKEDAAKLLQQAGGDKAKARELARQAGYTF
jgi:hypothetical protein